MSWIQVYSGKSFSPLSPTIEDIEIEDIAHALSLQCRYAGHCLYHYSIAQHSVLVSRYVSQENKLWGLLHDASEAYLMDVPRPIKQHPEFQAYRDAEIRLMTCIALKFKLPLQEPEEVTIADARICMNEKEAIMRPSHREWVLKAEPLPGIKIERWEPAAAEQVFLDTFHNLMRK